MHFPQEARRRSLATEGSGVARGARLLLHSLYRPRWPTLEPGFNHVRHDRAATAEQRRRNPIVTLSGTRTLSSTRLLAHPPSLESSQLITGRLRRPHQAHTHLSAIPPVPGPDPLSRNEAGRVAQVQYHVHRNGVQMGVVLVGRAMGWDGIATLARSNDAGGPSEDRSCIVCNCPWPAASSAISSRIPARRTTAGTSRLSRWAQIPLRSHRD
jgi:hypothetical protein